MNRPYQFKAQCLVCGHKGMVLHNSKEEYQEVTVCPNCNGAYVDTWMIGKYLNNDKSATDSTEQCDCRLLDYIKELETLLLHNNISLPSNREDIELPTRPEGSE